MLLNSIIYLPLITYRLVVRLVRGLAALVYLSVVITMLSFLALTALMFFAGLSIISILISSNECKKGVKLRAKRGIEA